MHVIDEERSVRLRSRRLNAVSQVHHVASVPSGGENLVSCSLDLLGRAIAQHLGVKVALQPNVRVPSGSEAALGLAHINGVINANHVRTRCRQPLE